MNIENLRPGMRVRVIKPESYWTRYGWVNGNSRTGEVRSLPTSVSLSFPDVPDNWVSLDNIEPYPENE